MDLQVKYIFFFCSIIFVEFQNQCAAVKWGCDYLEDSAFSYRIYDLELNNYTIYGRTIHGARINDLGIVQELLGKVHVILQSVISTCPYNTMDHVSRFFRSLHNQLQYRKIPWTNVTFDKFKRGFHMYKPQYHPDSLYGIVVKVLENLLTEYPQYAENVYLATVFADASVDYGRFEQLKLDIDGTFVHNHVAAILKISFNNIDGYILMDPIRSIVKPVLLWATDIYFYEDNCWDKSCFRMLPSYGYNELGEIVLFPPYIIQSHNMNEDYPLTSHLYYIRKPFCSMLYVTYKNELLNPLRTLDRRDADGKCIAIIYANVIENREPDEIPVFTVLTKMEGYELLFGSLRDKFQRLRVDRTLKDAGVPYMGYINEDEYKEKLKYLGQAMKNKEFVALYNRLIENPT